MRLRPLRAAALLLGGLLIGDRAVLADPLVGKTKISPVPASPPQRRTTVVTERLDAPVDLVWALVGDFSSLPRWDPLLKSFNATMTDGHLVRTARFDGWWIEERLDHRDNDAHQIDYEVVGGSRPEIIGATASIALTPIDKGATRIQWTSIAPDTKAGSTAPDADLAAYYHRRIGHLRAALGLAPKTTSSE